MPHVYAAAMPPFRVHSDFQPAGDQPEAIARLAEGIARGDRFQTLLGITGSGKSATLNNILNQVTAIYRPRMFIVEAGNSFGLMCDYLRSHDLSVHSVAMQPNADVSLPPGIPEQVAPLVAAVLVSSAYFQLR